MRILRPFSRYTKTFLVEPVEVKLFTLAAFGHPLIKMPVATTSIGRYKQKMIIVDVCKNAAKSATKRGWSDGFNYFLSVLHPIPNFSSKIISLVAETCTSYIHGLKQSVITEPCFIAAIRSNQVRMMMEIRHLMDADDLLYLIEDATRHNNATALQLILKWRKVEEKGIGDKLIDSVSQYAGEQINLQIIKILHTHNIINLGWIARGLFGIEKSYNKCDAEQRSKIREIAKFLKDKQIDVYLIAGLIVGFGDIEILEIFRVNITSSRFTMSKYIEVAREYAQPHIIRLLESWVLKNSS